MLVVYRHWMPGLRESLNVSTRTVSGMTGITPLPGMLQELSVRAGDVT